MRTPEKHALGAEVTFCTVQPTVAPSAAKPWSRVIWPAGIPPLLPTPPHVPTRSTFHGALVGRRLYSPVPSWKLEREKAARITVLSSRLYARPRRGRKLAIPLYWLYSARLLPFCPASSIAPVYSLKLVMRSCTS